MKPQTLVSLGIALLLGGLVGATLGKPFMVFFFTFWFLTLPAVVSAVVVLLLLLPIKRLRGFAFTSLAALGLFFAGLFMGMVVTGQQPVPHKT